MSSIDNLISCNIETNGLLENCGGVVLAVSGGSDSMTLLDFFLRTVHGIPFVVAHVNHGIREESSEEELFVKDYCEKNGVKCEVLRADIPGEKPRGVTTEEYARQVRYSFFREIRDKYGFTHIATAHNKNDATETFFMNIVRGAGTAGAAGLPVSRKDGVIRPLLLCEKKDILKHCEDNGIPFVTDRTNFEDICTRNVIRNDILPRLRQLNPRLDDAVSRFSALAALDDDYFEKEAEKALESFGKNRKKNEIPLSFLRKAEKPVVSRLLRRVYATLYPCAGLTYAQTNDIISLLESGNTSDRVLLSRGYYAVVGYENLRFLNEEDFAREPLLYPISEGENNCGAFVVTLKKAVVKKENVKNCFSGKPPFFVRSRKEGDRIRLYRRPEKSVRELFIDEKIPADKRGSMLIAVDSDDKVLWLRQFGAGGDAVPVIGEEAWEIRIKETNQNENTDN